jgi:hypothetical protein
MAKTRTPKSRSKTSLHRQRIASGVRGFHARRKLALAVLDQLERDGIVILGSLE